MPIPLSRALDVLLGRPIEQLEGASVYDRLSKHP